MKIVTYRDLIVWQKAFALCADVYEASEGFAHEERFGLTAEIRKTARSIVCNIAEGHRRRSTAEYIRFADIARGSGAELETQLEPARHLDYVELRHVSALVARADEIDRMLSALIRSLEATLRSRAVPDSP